MSVLNQIKRTAAQMAKSRKRLLEFERFLKTRPQVAKALDDDPDAMDGLEALNDSLRAVDESISRTMELLRGNRKF